MFTLRARTLAPLGRHLDQQQHRTQHTLTQVEQRLEQRLEARLDTVMQLWYTVDQNQDKFSGQTVMGMTCLRILSQMENII